jgi:hypothetical protein
LVLSSCSSVGSSPSVSVGQAGTPTSTASAPTPTAGVTTCQTTQLILAYDSEQNGLSNFANLYRLTNTSQQTCTLDGYPGVQLLDANQQPMTVTVSQQTSAYLYINQQPQQVMLASGASGYFMLEWNAGPNSCSGAAFVVVTPPGNQTNIRLADMVDVCTGSVIVSPIEPTAFS